MNNVFFAFLLTLIAGLCTGIGSLIGFFSKTNNSKFLSGALGFSAGVMIYVSMIEIFFKAKTSLSLNYGSKNGTLITIAGFFLGIFVIALIDKLLPCKNNPQEIRIDSNKNDTKTPSLLRTGVFTALAVGIHNFPEGFATFVSALSEPDIAIPIVVAIAIHNIPEGIAVSVPVYYATGSRKKAFLFSFASGLSEPLGAIIGYLILMPLLNSVLYGILFASVAGIMVFISVDELLPSATEYGSRHLSVYGLVAGMAVMAISLWLFM